MKPVLNMLELCYYNIKNTTDIYRKEKYLNRLFIILRSRSSFNEFIVNEYNEHREEFIEYMNKTNQEFLILLTGDLTTIQKYVNIPDCMQLKFSNNIFHVVDFIENNSSINLDDIDSMEHNSFSEI